MKVYDYKCGVCLHTEEHFVVNSDIRTVTCRQCGAEARRMIPRPRFMLDGTDPAYPTAWDRWAKDHEKRGKEANAKAEEHGE